MNDLQFLAGPAVADIDGDGLPEALQGSGVYDIHAVDVDGVEAAGGRSSPHGWMVQSPAVGDLDGDGRLEVVATTREGNLFVWRTAGDECGAIPWRRWHHDEWGTGNDATDARPPASLRAQEVSARATSPEPHPLHPGARARRRTVLRHRRVRGARRRAADRRRGRLRRGDRARGDGERPRRARPRRDRRRGGGQLLAGRTLYAALRGADAAGNVSAIVGTGPITFPTREPTETPTRTATRSRTATPVARDTVAPTSTATVPATVSATPTASAPPTSTPTSVPSSTATTVVPATATRTAPSTATAPPTATSTRRPPSDNGCAVVAPDPAGGEWWSVGLGVLLLMARRRSRR